MLFLEIMAVGVLWAEEDHQDFYQHAVAKAGYVMVRGCISVHGIRGNLHISEGSINAIKTMPAYFGRTTRPDSVCV